MIFEYINSDNSREEVFLESGVNTTQDYKHIQAINKKEFIKEFLPAFISGQKILLFDSKHKQLADFYNKTDINSLNGIENTHSQLLFFTSGSTGFPVGAFKTLNNIKEEIEVLKKLVKQKNIKKVIVTVPFIHIYGVLAGLLLPYYLENITLVVKEDFLPYELLSELSCGECLVITTPVFIKALGKLEANGDLSSSMFISSTGPLQSNDVSLLETNYNTSVMQLFGSTETGGIAYKFGASSQWIPLDKVDVNIENENLSVTSPFISEYILDKTIQKLRPPFITEDIIEIDSMGFTLLGRGNKIIKIAGKRISAIAIEEILETMPEIKKAIVSLVYKKDLLRSEQIVITLQADQKISKHIIKKKIKGYYGVLTIPFSVKYVDRINYSSMGKKILF